MRKFIGWIGVAIILTVLIAGFIAYFVDSTDPTTKIMHDGFGRPLSKAPLYARLVFGQERLWAGWLWLVADSVIVFGGILVGGSFMMVGFKNSAESNQERRL